MSNRLIIRKRAEKQLTEAYEWYEKKRTGLGIEFLLCVDAGLQIVQRNPFLFQTRHKNIHCALTQRFPYGIFYLIDKDKIAVVALLHLSRNPKLWKKKSS